MLDTPSKFKVTKDEHRNRWHVTGPSEDNQAIVCLEFDTAAEAHAYVRDQLQQRAQQSQPPTPPGNQDVATALEGLRTLNSQIEIFHAVRRIISSGAGPIVIDQIRGLYYAFDTKHPNAPKACPQ